MSKLLRGQIVGELPQTGEPGQLYFLRNPDDTYTQYVADDKGVLRKEKDAEGLTIEDVKTLITDNETKLLVRKRGDNGVEDVVSNLSILNVGTGLDVVGRDGQVGLSVKQDYINELIEGNRPSFNVVKHHEDVQGAFGVNDRVHIFYNGEEYSFDYLKEPYVKTIIGGKENKILSSVKFDDSQFDFNDDKVIIKDSAIKAASTDVGLTMDEQEVSPQGVVQPINFTITKDGKSETISYDRLVAPQIFAMVGVQQTPTTNEETEMATLFFDENHFEISAEDRRTIQLKQSIVNKLDKLTDEKIDKLLALLEKEEREVNATVGVWIEDEE